MMPSLGSEGISFPKSRLMVCDHSVLLKKSTTYDLLAKELLGVILSPRSLRIMMHASAKEFYLDSKEVGNQLLQFFPS